MKSAAVIPPQKRGAGRATQSLLLMGVAAALQFAVPVSANGENAGAGPSHTPIRPDDSPEFNDRAMAFYKALGIGLVENMRPFVPPALQGLKENQWVGVRHYLQQNSTPFFFGAVLGMDPKDAPAAAKVEGGLAGVTNVQWLTVLFPKSPLSGYEDTRNIASLVTCRRDLWYKKEGSWLFIPDEFIDWEELATGKGAVEKVIDKYNVKYLSATRGKQ